MATNSAVQDVGDAVLRSVSHNLRTPLTSIRGALSYLQQDPAYRSVTARPRHTPRRKKRGGLESAPSLYDAARRELIDNAVAEAERLNRVIGNLLDMARLEAGVVRFSLALCAVDDLIAAALDCLGEPAKQRVRVRVTKGLDRVPMDFPWALKALSHILDNAIRYSPANSPISIRAKANGHYVEITVADRGIGIAPEDLTRVFDKFYRVGRPEQANGTGVGLAICREVLAAHGGSIRADNRKGGGTVVTMTLPLHAP